MPDPMTVEFDPTSACSVESTTGQLDVNDNGNTATIAGAGQGSTLIQARCTGIGCAVSRRVLKIESGTTADISDVKVRTGIPPKATAGGILERGVMTLTDSTVTDTTVTDNVASREEARRGWERQRLRINQCASPDALGNDRHGGHQRGRRRGVLIFGDTTLNDVVTIEYSIVNNNTAVHEGTGAGIAPEAESTLDVGAAPFRGTGPTAGLSRAGVGRTAAGGHSPMSVVAVRPTMHGPLARAL
jgi:hypothetical protein